MGISISPTVPPTCALHHNVPRTYLLTCDLDFTVSTTNHRSEFRQSSSLICSSLLDIVQKGEATTSQLYVHVFITSVYFQSVHLNTHLVQSHTIHPSIPCLETSLCSQLYLSHAMQDSSHSPPFLFKFSQLPPLPNLLISLNQIPHFKTLPPLKSHSAFRTLSHFRHVFFHVFERSDGT